SPRRSASPSPNRSVLLPPPSRGRAFALGNAVTKRSSEKTAAMTPLIEQARWFELMQFYIREAWLLDERKYQEWLDVFTEDVLYFMPRRKNVLRRELHREL